MIKNKKEESTKSQHSNACKVTVSSKSRYRVSLQNQACQASRNCSKLSDSPYCCCHWPAIAFSSCLCLFAFLFAAMRLAAFVQLLRLHLIIGHHDIVLINNSLHSTIPIFIMLFHAQHA